MKVKNIPSASLTGVDNSMPSQYEDPNSQSAPLSPSFTTTILTRSAAKLHNLQHKRSTHQPHIIGKIVKPIPVRPVSSSSSTHSSSFSSHNSQTNQAHNNSLINLIKQNAIDSNRQAAGLSSNDSSNFSLIAKYFASFPATRLKTTHTIDSSHSHSQSPLMLTPTQTPFLPFKKTNSNSINATALNTSGDLKPFDLCTNFRRLIKLNDLSEDSMHNNGQSSPQTSNTPNSLMDGCESDLEQFDSRFGQITMETRSTRKFLIKHHPYLKYNQTSNQLSRPSINLLKMKISNNDEKLLKFTDTAPSPSAPKRRQSNPKNKSKSDLDDYYDFGFNAAGDDNSNSNSNNCETFNNSFTNELNTSKDVDDCKEEDSSGYYSSYHSVDLISTSGGSTGGDNNVSVDRQDKSIKVTLPVQAQSQAQNQMPNHHYHTRYLSNYLQQNQTPIPIPARSSLNSNAKQVSNNTSNMPITRLRYQQQLAAAASGDLDLDQIEND